MSVLGDTDGGISGFEPIGSLDSIDVTTDNGFTTGLGVGYRYGSRIAVEAAWEYRTNESETSFASGLAFPEGNYASNMFFFNGYYFLTARGAWEPYAGAGLAWVQEVDIDLEGDGPEQSFSGDGDVGFQVFVGSNYRLTDRWSVHGELRYGSVTGIELSGENVDGTISDFEYEPVTVQFGINYNF